MNLNDANIALVHDWFIKNSFGGGENVTFSIKQLFSENYSVPDIFAITSNIKKIDNMSSEENNIRTSFIQKLPFGKNHVQNYLPFLPFAIEQFDLRKYDLIVTSSHAFAKGILTSPEQLHVSYVHTPMRYAWDQMHTYIKQSSFSRFGFEYLIRYILFNLRQWDFTSSQRIDHLICNSKFTAKRIQKYWGLKSEVIHPPVEIERFICNNPRDNFYLTVNRLVPNKRVDLLIKAFNKLGLPLIIIGEGSERRKLENIAKPNIKFLRKLSNLEVADYMSRCRAFVYAGLEDFGIAPIEALASGAPVIALGRGGILDSINCFTKCTPNQIPNGILFNNQTSADIFDTINWFEDGKIWRNFDPKSLNNYAQKFNSQNFKTKLDLYINKAWSNFKK